MRPLRKSVSVPPTDTLTTKDSLFPMRQELVKNEAKKVSDLMTEVLELRENLAKVVKLVDAMKTQAEGIQERLHGILSANIQVNSQRLIFAFQKEDKMAEPARSMKIIVLNFESITDEQIIDST